MENVKRTNDKKDTRTSFQVLSVEGNHLLALPDDFDVQVASRLHCRPKIALPSPLNRRTAMLSSCDILLFLDSVIVSEAC